MLPDRDLLASRQQVDPIEGLLVQHENTTLRILEAVVLIVIVLCTLIADQLFGTTWSVHELRGLLP